MSNRPKPVVLLILDGFGCREERDNNAIALANTPCWDSLQRQWPMTQLNCSGDVVGLPDGQMGNSEVGHLHIGAGRYVPQDFTQVSNEIRDGKFFTNPVLCQAVDKALQQDKALHIMGLLSPGGVHSHIEQIMAMCELTARRGLKKFYVHAFLDGRDVPPKSANESLRQLNAKLAELGAGRIVSITGRFYAMDRDNRWERVQQAYNLIAKGEPAYTFASAEEGLMAAYERGETDEFVAPTAIVAGNAGPVQLDPQDSVVFMNFRADRAREISVALTKPDFDKFERGYPIHEGCYATLTQYHEDFDYPVAYPPIDVKNNLGEALSNLGLRQLRLAETEKYAHVTFFLNGGSDHAFPGEDRMLVPSPKVKTYDMQPEMSAPEVTEKLVAAIRSGIYDVIICNYANCDMVGHTGNLEASIKAVEAVDGALQHIVAALLAVGGEMLITADHGNIEKMRDEETGQPHTAHTTNPVPLVYVGGKRALHSGGSLMNLAPTLLDMLDVAQPAEMTAPSLLAGA